MTNMAPARSNTTCGECRRSGVRIARVHRGERYCQTCYKRMFKRRLCPKCGNFARLPRLERDAVCLKCENARPCVRCGRTRYRTGMRTAYGPACIACAAYFKPPEPCEACGTLSRWLSRESQLGEERRLCPRCRRGGHQTCEACRRHRPLELAPEGRRLCRACREQGEIPCPLCDQPMPAGCGKQCWSCYWRRLARRRIRIDTAGLASPALASRFGAFGAWLIEKNGARKAALQTHRQLSFFQQVEKRWNDIPNYAALLEHFGAAGLRRHLLVRFWMEEAGLIVTDAAAREADSDRRRIDATLDRFLANSEERSMLEEYSDALRLRLETGKLTLRSMRLALTPAAGLLKVAAARQRLPPDQKTLAAYLRETPGQWAAVNGFITHLRRTQGAELTMPKRQAFQSARERRAKLLAELLAVMRDAGSGETIDRHWVELALQYFHDMPSGRAKKVESSNIASDADGMRVEIEGREYWIPWPQASALRQRESRHLPIRPAQRPVPDTQ